MGRREKRRRLPNKCAPSKPKIPLGDVAPETGAELAPGGRTNRRWPDPATFELTQLARARLSHDEDLVKFLPVFDAPQTRLLKLSDLLQFTHLEERTLRRRLNAATGHRPHDLLLRLFLRDVARALNPSREPLEDIAARFHCNVAVLSRAFKRVSGMTVAEYRRRYREARESELGV